jgi:hypothetical protein
MTYDVAANDDAGGITLAGDVRAESSSGPLELNTMLGRSLTLTFMKPDADADRSADREPRALADSHAMSHGRRELKLMVVEGDAKIESRTWLNADRSDAPRILHIGGPSVSYDQQTGEAAVQGAGELLVRDDRSEKPSPEESTGRSFLAKGTTLFRWADHLQMTRQADGTVGVVMTGDVRVIHAAIDQSRSTLRADRLHATLEREGGGRAAPPAHGLDLVGGAMSLRRLVADGGVYVQSPARDIDCDQLEYDYAAGLASLSAARDRFVTITTKGDPQVIRARKAAWNTSEDKVTVTEVSQ